MDWCGSGIQRDYYINTVQYTEVWEATAMESQRPKKYTKPSNYSFSII